MHTVLQPAVQVFLKHLSKHFCRTPDLKYKIEANKQILILLSVLTFTCLMEPD